MAIEQPTSIAKSSKNRLLAILARRWYSLLFASKHKHASDVGADGFDNGGIATCQLPINKAMGYRPIEAGGPLLFLRQKSHHVATDPYKKWYSVG